MKPMLGIVMDPIHGINPKKDSTLGLLLAAQARQWTLFYMEPNSLFIENNQCFALMAPLTVYDDTTQWFRLGEWIAQPLNKLSVILMRQDPPVDRAYIHTTQILEKAQHQGVLVLNHPKSLRDYNEKLFALHFPEYCPPTLVTQSIEKAREFLKTYHDVIVKPLDGMGGASIFRLNQTDPNQQVIFESFLQREGRYFLLQKYLPAIKDGDKRVIMIDGEPVSYALARMPSKGETRANLAAGGKGIAAPLSLKTREICHRIGPFLKEKGLVWVGLDIIGDYLTEINITSPTCVRELEAQCGLTINDQLLDCIFKRIV